MWHVHKIWVVIRREFVARVRTKWFLVSTILGPVLMAMFIVLPIAMAGRGASERTIAVVDATTTGFGERLVERMSQPMSPIRAMRLAVEASELEVVGDSLAREVGEQALDGFLLVTDATVDRGLAEYRGSNASAQIDMERLRRALQETVLSARLGRLGVDPRLVADAQLRVELQTVSVRRGEVTGQSGEATFFMAYVMWFLLYMAILLYGVQVMGAVVEEKTTRVVEVLVSSLKPFQLLAGKVIGVGAVGLFQLAIWAIGARVLLEQRAALGGLIGLDPQSMAALSLPDVPLGTIVVLLVFFVLGFFLYAAMFAAVAAMSNSEAEARQAQAPLSMFYVIPAVISLMAMITEPDGMLLVALTLIPFSSPVAMPGRWVVSEVPMLDLVGSVVFLVVALAGITWVAGRIYRVGILMHGKRPSIREVFRWVRAS
jgi:ABC-2 type transport system permease protein